MNDFNIPVQSGVFFIAVTGKDLLLIRKIVLIK